MHECPEPERTTPKVTAHFFGVFIWRRRGQFCILWSLVLLLISSWHQITCSLVWTPDFIHLKNCSDVFVAQSFLKWLECFHWIVSLLCANWTSFINEDASETDIICTAGVTADKYFTPHWSSWKISSDSISSGFLEMWRKLFPSVIQGSPFSSLLHETSLRPFWSLLAALCWIQITADVLRTWSAR